MIAINHLRKTVMKNKNKAFANGLKKEIDNLINPTNINNIIQDLPGILKKPCNILTTAVEREVFLFGSIGMISGILPNIEGKYMGDMIGPNLYVYILGEYGGGKGGLKWAKMLAQQIHDAKIEEKKELKASYNKDLVEYKKLLNQFNKGEIVEQPTAPKKPNNKMLFIPINNSKSGVYQLLEENNHRGIMYATEGDTLVSALKQDYGNYSDLLRVAFHHETLDLFRREKNETINIAKPHLSLIISSTPNQLKLLIPSTENGLYSRFLYYYLKEDNNFVDVFDDNMNKYESEFMKYSRIYKTMYDSLETRNSSILFSLTKKQKNEFVKHFDIKKKAIIEGIDKSMAGTANRLGVIAYRIMMIFTSLRCYENNSLSDTIVCNQIDYDNAINIVEYLESHATRVFEFLGHNPSKKEIVLGLLRSGYSYRDIQKKIPVNRGNICRWNKELGNHGNHNKTQ